MDAKKCDRCGAFYMPLTNVTDLQSSLQQVVAAVKKPPKHITDVCDLCPECVKAFYDWLRSANKNNSATLGGEQE